MKQLVKLKYGTDNILFEVSDKTDIFRINEPDHKITPSLFATRLSEKIKSLNPDLSNTCIVVGDKTRLCGYPEYLPVLIQTLENSGAAEDQITVFIAYGTHSRQSEEECLAIYGNTYKKVRFIHHDCSDYHSFEDMGNTTRGTPVLIRRDIIQAGFLITFGAISHHYFAGYGGGRKLLFPGLGYKKSIYHNHSLFLDKKRKTLSLFCQSGILDKNPLAEDLFEYETFCPADLAIHGIVNSRGNVCNLLPGVGNGHFKKACTEHGKHCEVNSSAEHDLVIASCGGHPRDINFIQSHKAINNAAKFVRNHGRLIVLAKCRDGIGSKTFLPWFEMGNWEKAFKKLVENYEGNGGTALSMMSKLQRIKIFMVTDLSEMICKTIGVEKVSMDQVKMFANQSAGSLAIIPDAGLLVKKSP